MKRTAAIGILAATAVGVAIVVSSVSGSPEPKQAVELQTTSTGAGTKPPADDGSAAPAKAAAATAEKRGKRRRGKRITTDKSQFGTMLFDRKRQAIYLFDKEKTKKSKCYGACAKAWPPVLTKGGPTAGGKVKRSLLGTTKRRNDTRQVTYAGHPLYYYTHEGRNQVLCHNVDQFGGLWLVVKPSGKPAG